MIKTEVEFQRLLRMKARARGKVESTAAAHLLVARELLSLQIEARYEAQQHNSAVLEEVSKQTSALFDIARSIERRT